MWVQRYAQARVASSSEELKAGVALVARKYGWQFKLSRLTSRDKKNDTMIEVSERA